MKSVEFCGTPIVIEFRPLLRASRGKLLCGGERGSEVHAGSFLRERRIVLDRDLLRNAAERERILLHEVFHFVWWRLGNGTRASWEQVLAREFVARVRGEMGWSAECRKWALLAGGAFAAPQSSRSWRAYCCESFCDTASMEMLALSAHDEITLGKRARRLRSDWMEARISGRRLTI